MSPSVGGISLNSNAGGLLDNYIRSRIGWSCSCHWPGEAHESWIKACPLLDEELVGVLANSASELVMKVD